MRLTRRNERVCRAVSVCEEPANQKRGHRVRCTGPFVYQSTCEFACDAGYEIPAAGTAVVNCIPVVVDGEMSVDWDAEATPCEGELASKLKRYICNIMFIQANNFSIYLIIYLCIYSLTYDAHTLRAGQKRFGSVFGKFK